jgi:hypothetical protein
MTQHCENVRSFSRAVYSHLTEVFSYRLSFSELGLTDHFVLNLVRNTNWNGLQDVEIYKVGWNIESVYGNDLDLFVQTNLGTYNWYALQAKVMSSNGSYKDLKEKTFALQQQWDKLLDHETQFNSKTFYLLYNGYYNTRRPLATNPTRSDCIGIPPIQELGLGIVETGTIKTIRADKTPSANLYFTDVFPQYIDSIRKLFCCKGSLPATKKQFTRDEIKTDSYQRIYLNDNIKGEEIDNENVLTLPEGFAPYRIILSDKTHARS